MNSRRKIVIYTFSQNVTSSGKTKVIAQHKIVQTDTLKNAKILQETECANIGTSVHMTKMNQLRQNSKQQSTF